MPSNFEMVVIALLIVNLVITLYCTYRRQENYTTTRPRQPKIVVSNAGGLNIITNFSSNDAPITTYEYSINNGSTWKSMIPSKITNTTTSNTANFLISPTSKLDLKVGNKVIVRVSNMNGTSPISAQLMITSAMVSGTAGQLR